MHLKKESTEELLQHHKLRVTKFRKEVLELFQASEATLSLKHLEEGLHDFDRVTLYRTLKSFEDHGIIHKVPTEDNQSYYGLCSDHCGPDKHHHEHAHFTCLSCQQVFCVHMDTLNLPTAKEDGYKVKRAEVLLEGYCPICAKK